MNSLSLTGSFVIGAFVLMTLMYVFMSFTSRQQDLVMNEITQSDLANVGRILDFDFDKLGYRVSTTPKIVSIDTFSIQFLADLDNNGTADSVSYYRTIEDDVMYLNRKVVDPQTKTWKVEISELAIQGYDSANVVTYSASSVKSLSVTFCLDNQRLITDSTMTAGSYWRKRYFPKSL